MNHEIGKTIKKEKRISNKKGGQHWQRNKKTRLIFSPRKIKGQRVKTDRLYSLFLST
jgi:hypothetical protein